jgi:hypothetical protein
MAWVTVAIAFVVISAYAYHVQTYWVTRGSDGKEYYDTAEQIAAGRTIQTEVPYAYRIALPWLVARTFPKALEHGFRVHNIWASAAGAALLLAWLRAFRIRPGVAALATILYVANWIGPARFLYFYPEYVDPPFIAFLIGALLLMHRVRSRFSWPGVLALALVCFVGGFVRETILLAPVAFLFANVRFDASEEKPATIPAVALLLPLVLTLAALVLVRQIPMEPRRSISAVDAAVYLFQNKPLFTLPLSFFMTFGPILTVVLYDWRAVRAVAAKHFYLAVFFGGVFAASYIGGHETERYLIWAAPVAYLLIAIALQNHGAALMRNAWVFVLLVGAQALGEHVFFGIPDYSLPVNDWATLTTFGERAWGLLDRLVIIDDYSWNLWSYFGSRPFHFVQLCLDAALAGFLVWWLRTHPSPMRSAS